MRPRLAAIKVTGSHLILVICVAVRAFWISSRLATDILISNVGVIFPGAIKANPHRVG